MLQMMHMSHDYHIICSVPPETRAPMKQPMENKDTTRPCMRMERGWEGEKERGGDGKERERKREGEGEEKIVERGGRLEVYHA